MGIETTVTKKYGILSYSSLIVGVICFFIVFVPATRIANTGNTYGDYIILSLTIFGVYLSIAGIVKKTENNLIPIIALILSLSEIIYWLIAFVLLLTGQIEFAP